MKASTGFESRCKIASKRNWKWFHKKGHAHVVIKTMTCHLWVIKACYHFLLAMLFIKEVLSMLITFSAGASSFLPTTEWKKRQTQGTDMYERNWFSNPGTLFICHLVSRKIKRKKNERSGKIKRHSDCANNSLNFRSCPCLF